MKEREEYDKLPTEKLRQKQEEKLPTIKSDPNSPYFGRKSQYYMAKMKTGGLVTMKKNSDGIAIKGKTKARMF